MSQSVLTLAGPSADAVLAGYGQDPLAFMANCADRFGEIVPMRLEGDLYCLLTNPDHISAVLRERSLFIKAKDLQILKGFLGNGLLTSGGDFWQRQRRLIQPIFHQRRINGYAEVMVDYTQRMLQSWQTGDVRDIHEEMMRLTLNIVMKTIFDLDVTDDDAERVAYALDEAMIWFDHQMGIDTTPDDVNPAVTSSAQAPQAPTLGDDTLASHRELCYQNAIALLDETIYAMIDYRRSQDSGGDDLLNLLMQVQDADDGSRMNDQQLRDEVATLMLAGHETTANTLSWTWMLLAQQPQVYAKLIAELNTVLQGQAPTITDLPQLTYTHWVIKEAMRVYPPVTDVTREATQDCEIGRYLIPKGTTLIASQWVMHRNPQYFSEPTSFKPERWADDLEKRLPRGVYFPFGDGPRICIGKSFALMEAVLLLATIAQRFQLNLMSNQNIERQPSITLRPKHGIQVKLSNIQTIHSSRQSA